MNRIALTSKHFVNTTIDFLLSDLTFFNGVMGAVSLAQAIRLWWPDAMFDTVGYGVIKAYVNENVFALLPFLHFCGVAVRQYGKKFFLGTTWFWRLGQATHLIGALAFLIPALSVRVAVGATGLQTLGYCVISAAMVWQLFRTDA